MVLAVTPAAFILQLQRHFNMKLQASEHTLTFSMGSLHYVKWGQGTKVMLAFHGFGQTAQAFAPLAEVLAPHYTFYSFDLFYHGNSQWNTPQQALTKEYWQSIIEQFIQETGISSFSVCGFSIGCKLALATAEAFSVQVESLWLIAPDGIYTSPWYKMATSPAGGRAIFYRLMQNPAPLLKTSALLQKLRLLPKSLARFAESQLQSPAQRYQLYHTWILFSLLRFNPQALASCLNNPGTAVVFFLGTVDKVITHRKLASFIGLIPQAKIHTLASGHTRLIKATARFVAGQNRAL
jgi:pimeloyl-ACP methyl ester carboxylesterase